ncbi:hypothetical protein [Clostridium thermobutyricum]|uniref:hypothetical protein n=1 Tax=Clostridium thermobutyricum TaxID=29372 RepID=UPI002943CDDA|nr:hypothetical protein [Clostridium thermobutyricum]
MMKKYKLNWLIVFQIICIIIIIQGIIKNKIGYDKVNNIFLGIIVMLVACIYLYIAKIFWMLKKYNIYKAFTILNILYVINIYGNFIKEILNIEINRNVIQSAIIVLFLIGNIVLISIYNKNVQALKEN